MNAFKLILCDIREGIIRNKRYFLIPVLYLFEFMYADLNLNTYKTYGGVRSRTTFLDLMAEIFHGCDPIARTPNPDIMITLPYFWIAIFVFAVFVSFDFMHNDLTQFGIQVLSRSQKRSTWWGAKCVWCIASGIWFYALFLLTALIFCIINGYELQLTNTPDILNIIADRSIIYSFNGIPELSLLQKILMLLAPMAVICTLNMIQMLLCLFCKPMYSYLIIIGILLFGVLADTPVAFSRCAMTTMNNWFFEDGYPIVIGLAVCVLLTVAAMLIGTLYFKRYDILPDKE